MEYLRVHGWDTHQYLRPDVKGPGPYIKIYRSLIRHHRWLTLTDSQRGHLLAIWILAADKWGKIPNDPSIIKKATGLDKSPNLELFISLGLLEHVNGPLTDRDRDVNDPVPQGKARQGNTRQGKDTCPETSGEVSGPAAVEFIKIPVKEGEESITEEDVIEWEALYGRIDVRQTIRGMRGYWKSKSKNQRKTRRGIRTSINNWLMKDDGKSKMPASGRSKHDKNRAVMDKLRGESEVENSNN